MGLGVFNTRYHKCIVRGQDEIKAQGDLQGSKVKVKKGSFQYKTKR